MDLFSRIAPTGPAYAGEGVDPFEEDYVTALANWLVENESYMNHITGSKQRESFRDVSLMDGAGQRRVLNKKHKERNE